MSISNITRMPLRSAAQVVLYISIHVLCLAAIWTGVSVTAVVLCIALFWVRMFGITAGYHRYFSHRTYKMGRVMQFVMAWLAISSAQKGVLWWAGNHRHHHKYSDQPEDPHSPGQHGFWISHVGWFLLDTQWDNISPKMIREFRKYPEILWLERYHYVPVIVLAALTLGIAGWSGVVVGFLWSTVILWHATFTINSLAHVIGSRRYNTQDDSRNNWLLALLTMGEGWHNNHHYYQSSTRQGFFWWEIDVTYYILKLMSWLGLVWDLREPPAHVVHPKPQATPASTLTPGPQVDLLANPVEPEPNRL